MTLKLKAFLRDKAAEAHAAHKLINAELYGPAAENLHLLVDVELLEKALLEGGRATIIDLEVEGKELPVIIKDVQRDPLKNRAIHVDFYQVKDDKKVAVTVGLNYVGKSSAVANMGGILVKSLQTLKIECLPKHLVKSLDVDLGKLANLKDVIRVQDITAPEGVTIKNNPRDAVLGVMASRKSKSAKSGADAAKK